MTQEKLLKQRVIARSVLFSITFIALIVFIALYADERHRVQETYQQRYEDNLELVREDIVSYLEADGDHDMRYTRLMLDMSNAKEFAFLIENFDDRQIIVNELYTVLLKFPDQMQEEENLSAMYIAVCDILEHLDKGYEEARELVDSIDKLGH